MVLYEVVVVVVVGDWGLKLEELSLTARYYSALAGGHDDGLGSGICMAWHGMAWGKGAAVCVVETGWRMGGIHNMVLDRRAPPPGGGRAGAGVREIVRHARGRERDAPVATATTAAGNFNRQMGGSTDARGRRRGRGRERRRTKARTRARARARTGVW